MDTNNSPNPEKAGELAQRIVKILSVVDSETRRRAIDAAMMCLGEHVSSPTPSDNPTNERHGRIEPLQLEKFFNSRENLKPAENAQLCAAYQYSVYGSAPFSLDDIRTTASNVGVVLPDRLDMTFQAATKGGKKLFQPAGKGLLKPTAAAGLLFQERWSVRPGATPKA